MTKVRLQVMSDLHLEMHRDKGAEFLEKLVPQAEILILAGDLNTGRFYTNFIHTFYPLTKKFKHIVYVVGNHEFYNSSPKEVTQNLGRLRMEFPSVTVLDCNDVVIDGQRFVGGSMWFPKNQKNVPYKQCMNDFNVIRDFEPWVYEQNTRFDRYIRSELKPEDIVVTHHLPSKKSIAKQYKGSPLNCFFLHDVEDLIEKVQPRLWIHGHTHTLCDYKIGNTRVVANPHGYPSEQHSLRGFDSEFLVEV